MNAQLVCWHCQAAKDIEVDGPPQFGFEVAAWAVAAGWHGYSDTRRGRVLIFCRPEHAMAETTATGHFRARAKGPVEARP